VSQPESRLSRRLGTGDAVIVGLGAMIGTGVFVVWQPAAERAGTWLLVGLVVAAFVALCNATSSAELAAVHPQAGGTYVYGRERLGHGWGALAGYAFVFGKIASCATAAHAVGTYIWPEQARSVAVGAVVLVTGVNLAGVERTARTARWLVAVVSAVLAAAVVTGLAGTDDGTREGLTGTVGVNDVLAAAAMLFFAFAGYARIATLGEEVRDPARTIPRAVPIALGLVFVLYLAVGVTVLFALGPGGAAGSPRPITAVVEAAGADWLVPVTTIGAAIAALAALLALVAGISRTAFAMAHERDLPTRLAAVHPTRRIQRVLGPALLRRHERGGAAVASGRAQVATLAGLGRARVVPADGRGSAVADHRSRSGRPGDRHGGPGHRQRPNVSRPPVQITARISPTGSPWPSTGGLPSSSSTGWSRPSLRNAAAITTGRARAWPSAILSATALPSSMATA
jgi:APA family basic amino acid/polyamine antiporter